MSPSRAVRMATPQDHAGSTYAKLQLPGSASERKARLGATHDTRPWKLSPQRSGSLFAVRSPRSVPRILWLWAAATTGHTRTSFTRRTRSNSLRARTQRTHQLLSVSYSESFAGGASFAYG